MQKLTGASAGGHTGRVEACPHLGLEEDSSSWGVEPSPRHRCYLWMERGRIDLAHQRSFCLTGSHNICPWLSIGTTRPRSDSPVLPAWRRRFPGVAWPSGRIVAIATALWIWLLSALGQALSFLRLGGERALAGLRHLALHLGTGVRGLVLRVRVGIVTWINRPPLPAAPVEPGPSTETASLAASQVESPAGVEELPVVAAESPVMAAELPVVQDAPPRTRSAGELVEQGILALREGSREVAYALFVEASQLSPDLQDSWLWRAALAGSVEEKRECLEQILRVNPESSLAKSALALLEQAPSGAGADGQPTRAAEAASGPDASTDLAGSPPLVPSSGQLEAGPMSGRDGLLAQGLAAMKSGNEELAYDFFVKASKASPKNELAWYWRAKTAPTLDEVIRCLEKLLKINPGNGKAQADLEWALQRREREQVDTEPEVQRAAAAQPRRGASLLRRIAAQLRLRLLQIAAICTFALALALTIPGVLLVGLPDREELAYYLGLLPAVGLPKLAVHAPYFPSFDVGPVLPLILGLLLLHAAFVVEGKGTGTRVWMALLAATGGALMLFFGTNPPAPSYAAGLAALAVTGALVGGAPKEVPRHDELQRDRWGR